MRRPVPSIIPQKTGIQSCATEAASRDVISEVLFPYRGAFAHLDVLPENKRHIESLYCKGQTIENFLVSLGAPDGSFVSVTAVGRNTYAIDVSKPIVIGRKKVMLSFRLDIPRGGPQDGDAVLYSMAIRTASGKAVCGQGIGTRVFAQMVKGLAASGFEYIHCSADRKADANGYYTWPRLGFDAAPLDVLKKAGEDGVTCPDGSPVQCLLDIMETENGRNFWRKGGKKVEVSFDLQEGSRSWRVFRDYLREKLIAFEQSLVGSCNAVIQRYS